MTTRDLNGYPCQDDCSTVKTERTVEGAPVYRCPGCDAEWIELDERTAPAATPTEHTDTGQAADSADHPAKQPAVAPVTRPATTRTARPQLLHTVLDARDIRTLAEFYRTFLGLFYRPGDAPPFRGSDDADWLVLTHPDGRRALAFQANDDHVAPTWPKPDVPQQLHLDMTVPDRASLEAAKNRALDLGARLLLDRSHDEDEPLYVFADPAGHPFCVFVG